MTTEEASTALATYRTVRGLSIEARATLQNIAGHDSLPAPMRSEARRILIADRVGAR